MLSTESMICQRCAEHLPPGVFASVQKLAVQSSPLKTTISLVSYCAWQMSVRGSRQAEKRRTAMLASHAATTPQLVAELVEEGAAAVVEATVAMELVELAVAVVLEVNALLIAAAKLSLAVRSYHKTR